MPGETELQVLLRSMEPVLHGDEFVFCTVAEAAGVDAVGIFREAEGVTVICRRAEADRRGLPFTFPCRMITLNVHSSLEAVGFLAAIARQLARAAIPLNVVSAYHHDHLFVGLSDAERVMKLLDEIRAAA